MDKRQVETVVAGKDEGEVYESYGPVCLNDTEVWEVWVEGEEEFSTRFVCSDDSSSERYFSEFQQLAPYAQRRYEDLKTTISSLQKQLESNANSDRHSLIKLYVAAAVFLISTFALLYFILVGAEPGLWSIPLLTGLIASGGMMFFGAWKRG